MPCRGSRMVRQRRVSRDAEVDGLFDLAWTDGIIPSVRKTAHFDQHRHLIRTLFKHPPARRILFRSLVG